MRIVPDFFSLILLLLRVFAVIIASVKEGVFYEYVL